MAKKERSVELDYVRTAAMLGVIAIHVSSTFVHNLSSFALFGMNPAFWINQITRFSVPLFVLLSGLSLGFSKADTSWWSFIKSRFGKILLPYLFWSVLYFFFYSGKSVEQLPKALLWGQSASHLYFIIVILQLYLLYPLLKRAAARFPIPTLASALLISFVSHQIITHMGAGLVPRIGFLQSLWELFPVWIFYFVLGLLLHRVGVTKLCQWAEKNIGFLLITTTLCGFLYVYESRLTQSLDSIKTSLFLFTPLVLLTILAVAHKLRSRSRLNRIVTLLSQHSQTVFFLHLFLLKFLRQIPLFVTGMRGMLALLLVETLLSIAAAWCFDFLIARVRHLIQALRQARPSPGAQ